MAILKRPTLIVWTLGIAAFVILTVWSGADLVGQAVISVGAGAVLIVIARAVAVAGAGISWWLLFPDSLRPGMWTCVLLRFVREATNALLPLAQIGGDFIGARCLTLYGTKGAVAAASVVVDVLAQAGTQLIFAIVGLLLLILIGRSEPVVWAGAIGAAVAIPALAGFFWAQRRGGQRMLKRGLALIGGGRDWPALAAIDDLYARLNAFYAGRRSMTRGCILHLVVWFVGASEVWIVLHFMGYPAGFGEAVIIESLMHAVRGAAFAVPGALGVQEGALIMLCAVFAVPPEVALALSLVKRLPDLVLGLPGLITWQGMEGWHYAGAQQRATGNSNERA